MKLWGGRFEKGTSGVMEDFHSSISFDCRLYEQDIRGSVAHAKMLGKQGIIEQKDSELIVRGLEELLEEIKEGKVTFDVGAEDIHMNVETLLTAKIGEAGKRVHTGRSRNDQVALDLRMYLKEEVQGLKGALDGLCRLLIKLAGENLDAYMPGYTHLQKAQPITLAHHLMAYVEMYLRDIGRLSDCFGRMDVMPLGSGALAGSTYALDREYVREQLGFAALTQNSLDGVSDRDFCIEFASACSIIMLHCSRFCEELILWSTDEFRFVEMDDGYSTGSSIMPQKKNPDAAELIRGKTGRVYGDLMALLAFMKGLPLAYNKDMQEDKEAVFDALDTVKGCVEVFYGMISTLRFNKQSMELGAQRGFTNATDAADYLVKKGLPFRTAHEVIGALVLDCIKHKKALCDCSLEELKGFSPIFEQDIFEAISLETCVSGRKLTGGPAAEAVERNIKSALERLDGAR